MNVDRNIASRLLWIDALRGYAIIDVMGDHLYGSGIAGGCGVQLFFLVSAYSLLHSTHGRELNAPSFYLRRLFRIAPMFWLAVLLFSGLRYFTSGEHHNLTDFAAAFSFLFWVPSQWKDAMVPGSWSISCEILFYSVFPLLVFTIDNFRKSLLALGLASVLAMLAWPIMRLWAGYAGLANPSTQNLYAFHSITTQCPCFLLGFCVYFSPPDLVTRRRSITAGIVGLAVLVGCTAIQLNSGRYYFVFAGSFALITYALSTGSLGLLANRWIAGLGVISYSAYFWHFFWMGVPLRTDSDETWWSLAVVGLTLLSSAVTYHLVEKPGIKLGGRLSASLRGVGSKIRPASEI